MLDEVEVRKTKTVKGSAAVGIGMEVANQAIELLAAIPKDDPDRSAGFWKIASWVKENA